MNNYIQDWKFTVQGISYTTRHELLVQPVVTPGCAVPAQRGCLWMCLCLPVLLLLPFFHPSISQQQGGGEELPPLCPEQEPTLSHRGVFHTCEVEAGQNRSRASAVPALESFISNVGFSLPRDPSFPSPRLLKRDCPWESVHAEHGRCSQSCFLCFSLPGFLSKVSSLR